MPGSETSQKVGTAVEWGELPSEVKTEHYHAADHQAWSGFALQRPNCEVCRVSEALPLSFEFLKSVLVVNMAELYGRRRQVTAKACP